MAFLLTVALSLGIFIAVVAALAVRSRAYSLYFFVLLGIWMIAIVGVAIGCIYDGYPEYRTTREVITNALSALVFVGAFSLSPGYLVRTGGSIQRILLMAFLSAALSTPLWIYLNLVLGCYLGLDCL